MNRLSTRLGLIGVATASVLWLSMAALIAAFPAADDAPVLTMGDMAVGTLVGAILFGGVGAILGHLEDRSSKRKA